MMTSPGTVKTAVGTSHSMVVSNAPKPATVTVPPEGATTSNAWGAAAGASGLPT